MIFALTSLVKLVALIANPVEGGPGLTCGEFLPNEIKKEEIYYEHEGEIFPPLIPFEEEHHPPWMVSIQDRQNSLPAASGYHICSGTIISERHILTAGVCIM